MVKSRTRQLRTKIECDECGELKEVTEFAGKYYCDDCNANVFEGIDKNIRHFPNSINEI